MFPGYGRGDLPCSIAVLGDAASAGVYPRPRRPGGMGVVQGAGSGFGVDAEGAGGSQVPIFLAGIGQSPSD